MSQVSLCHLPTLVSRAEGPSFYEMLPLFWKEKRPLLWRPCLVPHGQAGMPASPLALTARSCPEPLAPISSAVWFRARVLWCEALRFPHPLLGSPLTAA